MGRGKAKGAAKGGFFGVFSYDIVREAGQMIQCAVCAVFCCLIVGPIMVVIGISMLGSAASDKLDPSSDAYLQKVITINKQIESWNDDYRTKFMYENPAEAELFAKVGAADTAHNLQLDTTLVDTTCINSETLSNSCKLKELMAGTGKYKLTPWKAAYYTAQPSLTVEEGPAGVGNSIAVSIGLRLPATSPTVYTGKQVLTCKRAAKAVSCTCSRNNNNNNNNYNNRNNNRNNGPCSCTLSCPGGQLTVQESDYNSRSGTCTTTERVKGLDMTAPRDPFTGEGTGWQAAGLTTTPTYTSVAGAPTSCNAATVPLTVRSVDDPYVILEGYGFDLGMTPGEKAAIGGTLLGLGGALTAIPIVGCVFLCKILGKRKQNNYQQHQTTGPTVVHTQQVQQQQAPLMATSMVPVATAVPVQSFDQ